MKKIIKIFTIILPLVLMLFLTTPKTYGYTGTEFTLIGNYYYFNWGGKHPFSTPIDRDARISYGIATNDELTFSIPSKYRASVEYWDGNQWVSYSNSKFTGDGNITVNNFNFDIYFNRSEIPVLDKKGPYLETHLRFNALPFDDVVPVINGETAFVTNIDDPISVSTITSYISAYDETDGDLTHAIVLADNPRDGFIYEMIRLHNIGELDINSIGGIDLLLDLYDDDDLESLNFEFLGTILSKEFIDQYFGMASDNHYFNFNGNLLPPEGQSYWDLFYYVLDSSGNGSTLIVSVLVKDITAPSWNTSKGTASIGYSQTFNVESYKTQLGASDNYYQSNELTITVQSNAYTANKTIPGTYDIVYRITDPSGNYTDATVKVTVVDDVAPTISGPLTITKPTTAILLLSEIKAQLTANDAIDGNLTSSIIVTQDNYTGKGHIPGNYTISFKVTDAAGNVGTHTLTVQVKDGMPPVFYVKDGYFINVDLGVILTKQEIIDILILTGQLSQSGQGGMQVYTTLDEYTGNEETPGIYAMSFRVTSPSGTESNHHVAIRVMSEGNDDDPIIITDPNWVEKNKTLLIVVAVIGAVALIVVLNQKPRRRRR